MNVRTHEGTSLVRASARCLTIVAILALLPLIAPARAFAATAPDYAYWFAAAQAKVYPDSTAPAGAARASDSSDAARAVLSVSAAQAEYEGRQIAVHAIGGALRDVWLQASDFTLSGGSATIPADSVSVFKVGYVRITHPSYGYRRVGLEPDPLIPMTLANGQRLGWLPDSGPDLSRRGVPADGTQPFYVLFSVPDGAAPGVYGGTITITCADPDGVAAPTVTIPVSLTVFPFSIAQRTLKTAFRFEPRRAAAWNSANRWWLWTDAFPALSAARVPERTDFYLDQMNGWLGYLSQHRISPQSMPTAWAGGPGGDGTLSARSAVMADYFGTGAASSFPGAQFAFTGIRLPDYTLCSYLTDPFTSAQATSLATNYYRSMRAGLGANASKAYVYPIDEPHASQIPLVKRYAAFIHRVIPGAKYLLTTDAGTEKNKLVPGVDIYVYRLHFFFRDSAYIAKMRAAHKEVWIYTHRTDWQAVTPMYLIDKPLTDSRVMGWFAFKTRASGILYYNINRWRQARDAAAQRDPYADPLTVDDYNPKTHGRLYANGDGSLVYPGYYPDLGLVVQGAPPVGSLRMEALRDGLEDYEYVKLVAARYGTAAADAFVAGVIGPVPKRVGGVLQFPKYAKTPGPYESVRSAMAARLSQ